MFVARGRPLTERDYYGELAGLAIDVIIGSWLEVEDDELAALVEERIERYLALAEQRRDDGADRPSCGLLCGGARPGRRRLRRGPARDRASALRGRLDRHVSVLVAADDVERGKPDPEGYLRAISALDGDPRPEAVVAFEDTEVGVAAAKAAGLYCVAVLGTHTAERLAAADEIVEAIDVAVVRGS